MSLSFQLEPLLEQALTSVQIGGLSQHLQARLVPADEELQPFRAPVGVLHSEPLAHRQQVDGFRQGEGVDCVSLLLQLAEDFLYPVTPLVDYRWNFFPVESFGNDDLESRHGLYFQDDPSGPGAFPNRIRESRRRGFFH